jgi:hypothetical protein
MEGTPSSRAQGLLCDVSHRRRTAEQLKNFSRVVPLRFKATMATIVGIFYDARDLDKAVERLARAGFEDTVYDESIVAGEAGNGCSSVVFAPGYSPAMGLGGAEPNGDRSVVSTASRPLWRPLRPILRYGVPAEVIQAYAVTFYHNGEFILFKADPERAEGARVQG